MLSSSKQEFSEPTAWTV